MDPDGWWRKMTANQIAFLALAGIALFGAMGVVLWGDRPVWSALSLVLNFFVLAFIYFTLGAEFLGITQIMVYAGAIMVLFLFVIMILKLGSQELVPEKRSPWTGYLAVMAGLAIAAGIVGTVFRPYFGDGFTGNGALDSYGKPQAVGQVMFSQYVWPFEIASILLLIGIVGSILLAKRRLR